MCHFASYGDVVVTSGNAASRRGNQDYRSIDPFIQHRATATQLSMGVTGYAGCTQYADYVAAILIYTLGHAKDLHG